MPDYRVYGSDGQGGLMEVSPEELAKLMGISKFDASLLLRGMNITKTICVIAGQLEEPPLIWNENMPASLVEFVTSYVADKLQSNPSWEVKDFEWDLVYEEDGQTLKYR